MPTPHTKLRHLPLLDGVRGIALLVVIGYHLGEPFRLAGAWVALDMFFVLSGFLITTLLLKERVDTGRVSLPSFFRRRIRRLAPGLLVTIAAVFAVVWAMGWTADFPDLRGDGLASLFYYANWHFIWSDQSYFSSFQQSPLRHMWSLAIEEQFYLLWPLVFFGLTRALRNFRWAIAGLLTAGVLGSAWWMRHLVLGGADLSRAYYGTDTRAQAPLIGALLAVVVWRDRWDTPRGRRVGSIIGLVALPALAVMAVTFTDTNPDIYTRFGFLLVSSTGAALVYGLVRAEGGPLHWFFGNRVALHLGAISYVVYLWHWPVIVLLDEPRVSLTGWPLTAVHIVASFALAEATHWAIERPIHRRRFTFPHEGVALAGVALAVLALVIAVPVDPAAIGVPDEGQAVASVSGTADAERRVLVLGDSGAWVLSEAAPDDLPFRVEGVSRARCDIIGDEVFAGDQPNAAAEDCARWREDWAEGIAGRVPGVSGSPDVVVVSLGLRQLYDLDVDGRRVVVGSPEWEERYRAAVQEALGVIRSGTDAPVLWQEVACYDWAAARSAGEEADPARIDEVNRVLVEELSADPAVEIVPYRDWVCPDGELDPGLRPDGAHLTVEAVDDYWTRELVPRIDRLTAG